MLVAALDTATLALSCALVEVEGGRPPRLVAERLERAAAKPEHGKAGGHSAALPQVLVELLTAEGLQLPAVGAYAIGLGPGSFTGLRIGLATWKGLAYANKRPVAGGSSLAALALAVVAEVEDGTLLVPLLDAKKGEVYAGFYRARGGHVVEVAPEAALPPAALGERVRALAPDGERALAFGEGFEAHAGLLAPAVPRLATAVTTPPARAIAALVAERLAGAVFDAQALFALEPHYVRPSEAELKFPKGLGPGARGS